MARYDRQVTRTQDDTLLNDPGDLAEQYPYVYAQWAKSDWSERQNYLGLGTVEDIDTGLGVFAEAGRAWDAQSEADNDTLVDIGAGFLFSPSRSTRNEIIRLDITFPLTDGEGVDQFLLFAGTQLKV